MLHAIKQQMLLGASTKVLSDRIWLLETLTNISTYTNEVKYPEEFQGKTFEIGAKISTHVLSLTRADLSYLVRMDASDLFFISGEVDPTTKEVELTYLGKSGAPIWHWRDAFYLRASEGLVFEGNKQEVLTSVGIYLENRIVLGVFNGKISYVEKFIKVDDLRGKISSAAVEGKITVEELERFIDRMFFLNHMTEVCAPTMTARSLLSDPENTKIKQAFLEQHKDDINDPLVAKQLEDELKKKDKAWIGDDASARFFNALGGKSWDIHRKKMFLTTGSIENFTSGTGSYVFVPNSLMEGWTIEDFPMRCNEIRKGSYGRGTETAKGGAETKWLMRIFQDLSITEDDCGTTRGIYVDFNLVDIKLCIGRIVLEGNRQIEITPENKSQFDKKIVKLRSPQTCETKNGLCFECVGRRYKTLNSRAIGIESINITSRFMLLNMKNMHGTTIETTELNLADVFF